MDDVPNVSQADSDASLLNHHPRREEFETEKAANSKAGRIRSSWLRTCWYLWRCIFLVWIFIVLIAALEALSYTSGLHGGVADADSQIFYLWQYVPTAIFVGLSVLWAGLDYFVKQLAPWSAMSRGFARAEQTLLVDYLSPMSPITIWRSIRHKHLAVTTAVVGSLLLKLLAVLSTALFEMRQLPSAKHTAVFQITDQFSSINLDLTTEDSRPVDTAFAILGQNLTYPAGSNDQHAVQSFLPTDDTLVNATLTARVDVFSSALSCETISTIHNYGFGYSPSGADGYLTVNLTSASCGAATLESDFDYDDVESAVLAFLGPLQCSKSLYPRERQAIEDPQNYILALAAVRISDMIWPEDGSPASATVDNASIILCSPSYSIQPALVTTGMNATNQGSSMAVESTEGSVRKLTGMTDWDLAMMFLNLLSIADLTNTRYWYLLTEDDKDDSSYLKSVLTAFGSRPLWPTQPNPTTLSSTLEAAFNTSAVQIAKQLLTVPTSQEVPGFYRLDSTRVAVNALILRLLEAGLAIGLALTVLLTALLLRSRSTFRTPTTIAAIAAILSRSPDVSSSLMPASTLHGRAYRTLIQQGDSQVCIVSGTRRRTAIESNESTKAATSAQYWLPQPLRLVFSVTTLVITLIVVALLEILLHVSNGEPGLGQVDGKPNIYPYVWHIVSAGIMTMVAVMFESLEFAVTNLETFRYLSGHAATAKQSILRNFNGRSSAYSLYQAFRYRRVTIATASLLSLVSPFLTIFASGLYSAEYPESSVPVSLRHLDWFNTSTSYSSFSSGLFESYHQSIDATLIQYDNLTYPQWTHSEVALAQVATTNRSDHGTTLHARIPAVRASVQCAPYPSAEFFNATGPDSYFVYPAMDCGSASTEFNRTSPQKIRIMGTYFNESGYFGGFYAPSDSSVDDYWDATCGTIIFGLTRDANSTSATSFHALHCLFGVDQLLADTVLSLPHYNIISSNPIESTISHHSNITLSPAKVLLPVNASLLYGGTSRYGQYTGFLTALTHGIDAIPATELLTNTTTFVSALTHFYRVSMAQVMSNNLRTDYPDQALPASLRPTSGSVTVLHTRIHQNATSTRLLEALLALLVLLALIVHATFRPRKILYENPNSIAALGRLLVGSELLHNKDLARELNEAEACGWKRREMDGRGLLKGWSFRLREVAGGVDEDAQEKEREGAAATDGKRKAGATVGVWEKIRGLRAREVEGHALSRRRVRIISTRDEV